MKWKSLPRPSVCDPEDGVRLIVTPSMRGPIPNVKWEVWIEIPETSRQPIFSELHRTRGTGAEAIASRHRAEARFVQRASGDGVTARAFDRLWYLHAFGAHAHEEGAGEAAGKSYREWVQAGRPRANVDWKNGRLVA